MLRLHLAVGLVALGLVLKIIDQLPTDWDVAAAFQEWWQTVSVTGLRAERTEDVMLEIEKSKTSDVNMRLIDRRREQLKELASVEKRLQMPQNSGPIVWTPLPPPSYESPSKQPPLRRLRGHTQNMQGTSAGP